jgi:ubiquinone/menaquinone biosynthesis C-methylase UbiE
MSKIHVTRGYGLLEGFLAQQRVKVATKLFNFVPFKGRILDLGCGSYPLFLISTNFHEKFGIDKVVSEEYREQASEQASMLKISLLKLDIEQVDKMPFKDNYFDAVSMLAVFEHLEPSRLEHILKEINRILKPGGMYVMTTPAVWTDIVLRSMARLRLVSHEEIEEHKGAYSRSSISATLQKAGFSNKNIKSGYFEMFMNTWSTVIK